MVTAAPLPGDDLIGTIIDDRYRVEARVGAGGMGTVYRSTYLPDNVTVALKLMPPSLLADDISVARFQREARVIGRLQHPNILRLHSFGKTGNQPYLAMQYVSGGDLSVLLRSGPLSLDEIEHLLGQIASALDYAHENQVIHRDIKPSNILLDDQRNAIIADFGLARAEGMDEDRHLTRTGVWMGTPAYIAPELAGDGRLTPSVDLYALGCILYQMLTNELPFQADSTVGFIMQHLGADRPDVRTLRPDLPVGLTAMLRRAIARNVTDRYPTGAALVRAFSDARHSTADQSLITESPNVTVLMAETIRSPFKGLEAFEEADALLFYGREAIVQQVIDQLGTPDAGFAAVIGASGSGKSSLVRAGVVPRLRRNGLPGSAEWPIMIFTPGTQPLRALANQLQFFTGIAPDALVSQIEVDPEKLLVYTRLLCMRQPDRTQAHVLLIIDQFEEVFTRTSEKHRASFLKAILGAATDKEHNVIILPTMRADFYQHVTAYPDPRLATLFQNHQVIARTMTPTELRSAIESPAEAVGLRYESGLVETVLNDIADEPGSLPLLQYALQELYRKRAGFTMTRQVYELSGGVQGAVARRAEMVYSELDKPGQALMRRILLRLVEINESGDITRRRVLRDQLVFDNTPDEAVETVLDQLTRPDVRLLTANRQWPTGHQEIDVSHEALIHRWERLQDWVRQDRSNLLLGGNLLKAAHDWQRSSHDPAYLLRGVRLDEALHWVTMAESDVSPDQRQLITASVTAREQEEQEREKQRQYEIELERARAQNAERARNLLRWMLGGAVCFTVLAVVLAVLAFSQARAAQMAQLNAERKAAEVESLALAGSAANALDDHSADLALSLALEANKMLNPPPQSQQALSRIVDNVATIRPLVGHTDWVSSVAYAPDGETAITTSWDGTLRRWRINTGETLRRYEGHTDHVSAVAISPDGQTMLSGSWDGSLILWNVESGAILRRFTGHSSAVTSVALSPDGKLALSGSWDKTLIVWNLETGTALRSLKGHTDRVNSLAISPDGKTVLSGSSDASLILWDMATGAILRHFTGHASAVMAVAISPDGKTALSGSADKRVILWNIETGDPIWSAGEHTDSVTSVAFSADGKTALSGSADRSLRLWNVENGSLLRRLDGHTAPVLSVAFASDSNTVLSGAEDNTARLWDVEIRQFVGHKLSVSSVAITPDGKTAISGSIDTTLIVWDVTTGKLLRRLTGHTDVVENVAISPDGKTALSASDDKQLILWDITTGSEIRRFAGHKDWIANVVFSPDGKTALSGSGNPEADKSLILWDVSTGKEIRRFEGHTDAVPGLAFSPDGKTALSGSWDRSLILWDVTTGQIIRRFTGHKNKVWLVAMSRDGKLALSASEDGTARLWNLATGDTVLVLSGHTDAVFGVAFSPDGKTALTASADKTVRLWDLATGREIRRFEGHTDRVWQVVFTADGQTALSASADKTIRLWHISRSLDELMTWAYTHRYVRDITCEERDQYMIEPFCEATPAPILTMPPSVTATPATLQPVRLGETRGHIPVGGGQIWTYTGRAGEYLNIRVNADKPANEAGSREQQERDLFDARFIVRAPDGKVLIEADDVVTTTLRTTDPAVEYLRLPVDGAYQIEVRSFGDETGGAYTMLIESQETGPTPTPTGMP